MHHQNRHHPGWMSAAGLRALVVLAALTVGAAAPARAAEIAIVQPAHEETIHSNQGEVRVGVQTTGAAPGSSVRLLVDGAALPNPGGGPTIALHGIERGTHVLKAELLSADGTVIATSPAVTFHLWHASRRNPSRAK